MHIKKGMTYIGIDESTMQIGNPSLVLVLTATTNPSLAKDLGYGSLAKAKDLLEERTKALHAQSMDHFPGLDELTTCGLQEYKWMRLRYGAQCRQLIEHAAIGHLVSMNGFNPQRTVLMIDAFYRDQERTREFIVTYLKRRDFPLPKSHIEIYEQGDQSVPIINYADLLAFQIGCRIHNQHHKYFPERKPLPVKKTRIAFKQNRLLAPLTAEEREIFRELIAKKK
jgi:hypothetical protein